MKPTTPRSRRSSARLSTATLLSRASENVRAARFLSGACQGCQILVRKNRVRAGQGRPKPQQVEPADRNPDKKRGTPTPGSVPETCQERRASHASRASHAMRGPPPGPTAAGPGEEGNPHDRPPTG